MAEMSAQSLGLHELQRHCRLQQGDPNPHGQQSGPLRTLLDAVVKPATDARKHQSAAASLLSTTSHGSLRSFRAHALLLACKCHKEL